VHVHAHIALIRQVRRARVQTHPHADRTGGERSLPLGRGLERLRGGGKDVEERVTLRVHLHAAVTDERFAQQSSVPGQRLPVALGTKLVQQPGRALHVREQEGDGARRKLVTHEP